VQRGLGGQRVEHAGNTVRFGQALGHLETDDPVERHGAVEGSVCWQDRDVQQRHRPGRRAGDAPAPGRSVIVSVGSVAGISATTEVPVMPKGKKPGPSVKKPKTYEALKDKGMSKERAAKISNAQAGKQKKSKSKKKNNK
jgi:hypothetical protein